MEHKTVALVGNPNVGKSTVFNALTGMKQHTGNWPGKTVAVATGTFSTEQTTFTIVDLPGTYSLAAHSAEEEITRDYVCFSQPDIVIAVCDATCLERNFLLVLQLSAVCSKFIICINLLDEAKRRGLEINIPYLERIVGVPIVGISANKKKTIGALLKLLDDISKENNLPHTSRIAYPEDIENAIETVSEKLESRDLCGVRKRFAALAYLENDENIISKFKSSDKAEEAVLKAKQELALKGIDTETLKSITAKTIADTAASLCKDAVKNKSNDPKKRDTVLDRIFTSKLTGYPIMLLLLMVIFWITISGANYPSELLSKLFGWMEIKLGEIFEYFNAPPWLKGAFVNGMFRMLSWVVAVMLPPMAIFFPLFTLLEDFGYLPRIAYNLDKPFARCKACGKQALTMCMGFGCNAVGVTGCRIIDSPRERLLAILTNSFVPCNGRFPAIISVITIFFISSAGLGALSTAASALSLTLIITIGVIATFLATRLLSATVLKGVPSSFTLELPPYRKPQICKVLVRSVLDRTVFILGRAVAVAAPAGLIIWFAANTEIGDSSLLTHCADFLDPLGKLMGLDGVIITAFILGFPANETVVPLMLMAYTESGVLTDAANASTLQEILLTNGWSSKTAICFVIFSLMHWPCSTTLMTVKKETGSIKWTLLAAFLPTVFGIICCMAINAIAKILF